MKRDACSYCLCLLLRIDHVSRNVCRLKFLLPFFTHSLYLTVKPQWSRTGDLNETGAFSNFPLFLTMLVVFFSMSVLNFCSFLHFHFSSSYNSVTGCVYMCVWRHNSDWTLAHGERAFAHWCSLLNNSLLSCKRPFQTELQNRNTVFGKGPRKVDRTVQYSTGYLCIPTVHQSKRLNNKKPMIVSIWANIIFDCTFFWQSPPQFPPLTE